MSELRPERVRELRLASQRLSVAASSPREATRAIIGVQAQDVRAARLALRSRVPGLEPSAIDSSGLVRTWTLRGTVHLHDERDLAWIQTLCLKRNERRFDAMMKKRGNYEAACEILPGLVALLAECGPMTRASILAELAARGYPDVGPYSVNVLIPWAASKGVLLGLPDGRLRAAESPPEVEEEAALATLAVRYLEGFGPASVEDLAAWSGLPLGLARRAFGCAGPLEAVGDGLMALPGLLAAVVPRAPRVLLLAAFDVLMLGYASRGLVLDPAHSRQFMPGAGMLRPLVLADGVAAATWRLTGAGRRRAFAVDWFAGALDTADLAAELSDVGRFLGLELLCP